MQVGLFFGSFNPIHIGHMVIANYMIEFTEIQQLWFVVSPQSPFKQKASLLDGYQRIELINRAIGNDYTRFKVSDIEFNLPIPSYTINTLTYLSEKYPHHTFSIIMGEDNLQHFKKWKNWEQIIEKYEIYVYRRLNSISSDLIENDKIKIVSAPIIEISSSFIRKAIHEKKDLRYFLPEKVYSYIDEMNYYKK
ncbi:MAG TPA: nicotinic acid mononucleotide adenylyltransferase [Bacteroidales bacterium]|nr:MAG: nicotinic acid mononucleotide adenylyltransferase [Bacteroidetes bacterium GWF2_33_38]OFY75022.1 MAG: nicotinic acid mononucleotide adenylyltransferase [Bacteroidetes bacterium RIFOXYA12_FULL_33_9]OFY88070.1 MAG: nicotinic acid mononucleotide adenylyltransferase [Bacteroidetes bacterium RIFOXYA2_FULL_33_7]HBF87191.1 nicotinic acid mononucleotide adenylyltransferase [Bacteroidales bacterium]